MAAHRLSRPCCQSRTNRAREIKIYNFQSAPHLQIRKHGVARPWNIPQIPQPSILVFAPSPHQTWHVPSPSSPSMIANFSEAIPQLPHSYVPDGSVQRIYNPGSDASSPKKEPESPRPSNCRSPAEAGGKIRSRKDIIRTR